MELDLASEVSPITAPDAAQTSRDLSLSPAARAAVAAGRARSTDAAYNDDWEAFKRWCASVGRTALPATGETLAEYATHLAYRPKSSLSPASIERARSAIRAAHRKAGIDAPDSGGLADVVKGYREALAEAKDPRAKVRKATAATKAALTAIVGKIDRTTPKGRRDTALILLGFAVAGRRSELVALDVTDLAEADEGLVVSLYRRKTRKHHDVAVPYAKDSSLCPVLAAKEWLEFLAAQGRTAGPLFVRVNRHGQLASAMTRDGAPIGDPGGRMTADAISDVVEHRALSAGLGGRWRAHSVRRGFATEAHRAGTEKLKIARHGGWDDDSAVLEGYIEDAGQWEGNALNGVL
jgi:site-specific recombinase XerD